MSLLRTPASLGVGTSMARNDDRCQIQNYSDAWQRCGPDVLWPRSRLYSAGQTMAEACMENATNIWDWSVINFVDPSVGQRRDGITGVTRDVNGVPISGISVKLFDKATDLLVDTVLSDASGNFTATTPNTGQQVYAVAVNASNTLFGATAAITPS